MARSTEWTYMCLELKKSVVSELRKLGFEGSFPHLRRYRQSKVELISFLSHSNVGGAYEVGASVIFLDTLGTPESNMFYPDAAANTKKLTWCHGRIRNGLPGVYDGAFYYVDVYSRASSWYNHVTNKHCSSIHYTAVSPKVAPYIMESLIANHYELVQKADSTTYVRMAEETAKQMTGLLMWFDRMNSYDDLLKYKNE